MIQYKDIWYKDDGALTRVFCEDGMLLYNVCHLSHVSNV